MLKYTIQELQLAVAKNKLFFAIGVADLKDDIFNVTLRSSKLFIIK